mmetsp:Transcript_5303/g.11903  ORF Transcript_5303/g.11903 Transcript_5303/m.11903 type:complete len:105 (+) Transcript_5303:1162-1476(+)
MEEKEQSMQSNKTAETQKRQLRGYQKTWVPAFNRIVVDSCWGAGCRSAATTQFGHENASNIINFLLQNSLACLNIFKYSKTVFKTAPVEFFFFQLNAKIVNSFH